MLLIVKMLYFRNYATIMVMPVKMYITTAKSSWMALIAEQVPRAKRALCRNTEDMGRGKGQTRIIVHSPG